MPVSPSGKMLDLLVLVRWYLKLTMFRAIPGSTMFYSSHAVSCERAAKLAGKTSKESASFELLTQIQPLSTKTNKFSLLERDNLFVVTIKTICGFSHHWRRHYTPRGCGNAN